MQKLLSPLLIGLLLMCPLLCQAAQGGRCVVGDELGGGERCAGCPCEDGQDPGPCPDDGVTCIYAGAVQTLEGRALGPSPETFPNPDWWLLAALAHAAPPTPQSGLRSGAGSADWIPWGHPLRVHALTRHFRC